MHTHTAAIYARRSGAIGAFSWYRDIKFTAGPNQDVIACAIAAARSLDLEVHHVGMIINLPATPPASR